MNFRPVVLLAAVLSIAACSGEQQATEPPADADDASVTLNALFDEFFKRNLELNPLRATMIGDDRYDDRLANSIGPEYRAANTAMEQEFLQRLLEIDRGALPRQDQLSYDLFEFDRRLAAGGPLRGHLKIASPHVAEPVLCRADDWF